MSSLKVAVTAALACAAASIGAAQGETLRPSDFGQPVSAEDLMRFVSIPPSGKGLPPGRGDAKEGAVVYANACASCHGEKLEGIKATGAPALIGGRGTLTSSKPVKTVESYWPFATTVFDYVKRAMPFNAPGSLSDDQVYAVTAYILDRGDIIASSETMDATTLPKVRMPNSLGFVADPRARREAN